MTDNSSSPLVSKLARILYGLHHPNLVAPLAELIQPLDTPDNFNRWAHLLADNFPFPAEIRDNGTPVSFFALPSDSDTALLRTLGLSNPRLQHQALSLVSAALHAQAQHSPLRFIPLDILHEEPDVRPGFILLSHRFASNLAQALATLFAPQHPNTADPGWHSSDIIDALHSAANPIGGSGVMDFKRNNWRTAQDLLAARKILNAHLIIEYTQRYEPPFSLSSFAVAHPPGGAALTDPTGPASELDLWNQYADHIYEATALLTGAPLSSVSLIAQLRAAPPSFATPQPTPHEWIQLRDSPSMQAWLQLASVLPNSHLLDPLHLLALASVLWLRDRNPSRLPDIEPLYLSLTS